MISEHPKTREEFWGTVMIAVGVLIAMCGVAVFCTWAAHLNPDCIRFKDSPWVINADGVLMKCEIIDEQSLDVECRKLEVKPCPK